MATEENKEQQLNINIPEDVFETYANLAVINHSPTEFVTDFIQFMPGMPQAKVKARVILSPLHAKQLLGALAENVRRYEANFGEIKEPAVQNTESLPLFGAKGEA